MSVVEFDRGWHHPDDCDCGCRDRDDCRPCPPNLDSIVNCWRQINELKEIIAEIIGEIGGPIKTGPIQGVINGQAAKIGNVGEVVSSTVNGVYGIGGVQNIVPAITLSPGDWDVQACCTMTSDTSGALTMASYSLTPAPTGMSDHMTTNFASSINGIDSMTLASMTSQANISVPTLMVFTLHTQATDTGSFAFTTRARRAR